VTISVGEPDDQTGQLLTVNNIPISTFWLAREAIIYEITGVLIPESIAAILPAEVAGAVLQNGITDSDSRVFATKTESLTGEADFREFSDP